MGSGSAGRERGRGRVGDPNRKGGNEGTFVSQPIKWLLFSFNMFFWLVSWGLIAIGVWAYFETIDYQGQSEVKSILDIIFNFSYIFMICGVFVFILAFFGAVGSLRENTCLLKTFAIALGILFLAEVGLAIAGFALSDTIKLNLEEVLRDEAIDRYRDDINLQNIIDWFQETFECCGVSADGGYKDWERNVYFNCSSKGFEKCSVPYSCCIKQNTFDDEVINTMCGQGVLELGRAEAGQTIFTVGCVDASIQAAQDNLFVIAGVALGIVIPELIGIFLAKLLAGQIEDQRSRYA